MKIRKSLAIAVLVLSSFAATSVSPSKSELESMYDKAFREFDTNNFSQALKELDAIDARQPDLAESQNLRGVILMRQGSYDKAEAALRKALEIDPRFWNARFNLAEIPFLRKDWPEARNRFEALMTGNPTDLQPEATQLIQYKILLTYLLEGKENMIDPILNKFELSSDTPAVYYANAAVALHHKNTKEAKDWMVAAEKSFSSQLNKLFAESFYEVGWMEKPAGQTRAALELTSAAERAAKMKSEARAKFDDAERAFQQRDLAAALKHLDESDAADPNQAASYNLRGEILMEQKDFDGAEAAFKKAFKADPKFREAQYNLAQIPFKKKEYSKSRDRLEALFGETPGGEKNQAAQLIKFKIFMTLLLEGKDSRAQKVMDQFKFTGDTPALYYAQAAWEFKHENPDKGNEWIASARKIYSPALNIVFADSFYDLGWLQSPAATASPGPVAVANAETSATTEGSAGLTLAQATPAPVLGLGDNKVAESTSLAPSNLAGPNAALANGGTAEAPSLMPAPPAAASSPALAPANTGSPLAVASAAPSVTITSNAPAAVATAAPVTATEDSNRSQPPVAVAAASPAIASAAASTPATVLAPPRIREWAQPSFGETMERLTDPHTLLVGGLLLGGVVLLVWLLVQQVRRHVGSVPLYRPAGPVTAPRFTEVEPVAPVEAAPVAQHKRIPGGPPKLSLQLKASEPSVRRSAVPLGIPSRPGTNTPSADPVVAASAPVGAETGAESDFGVSEPIYADNAEADLTDLRDKADVSLPPVEDLAPSAVNGPESVYAEPIPAAESPVIEAASFISNAAEEQAVSAEAIEPPTTAEAPSAVVGHDPTPAVSETAASADLAASAVAAEETHAAAESVAPLAEAEPPPVMQTEPVVSMPLASEGTATVVGEPLETIAGDTKAAEVAEAEAEPIGQGQPIPYLTPVESTEPLMPEITQPTPQSTPGQPGAGLAGLGAVRPSVETPSFAPQAVSTQPVAQQPSTPATMPEPITQTPPAPARPAAPATGGMPQSSSAMQTAVQLTFSLEIASLQLTPSFKMGSLQLKPTSKIVTMRLAPSQHPQPAMNLQVTFEIATVQLGANGNIAAVRLTPSQQQKPGVLTTPAFEISGLQLVSSFESAPVQLTPSHQGQASVHMTASFNIATVEFSPSFEISSILLNSNSRNASVQLPGAGPSSIEGAPVFEMTSVQLGANNEIAVIQLNPPGAPKRA